MSYDPNAGRVESTSGAATAAAVSLQMAKSAKKPLNERVVEADAAATLAERARILRGQSVEAIAKQARVLPSAIRAIEGDREYPLLATDRRDIAKALGLPEDLVDAENSAANRHRAALARPL